MKVYSTILVGFLALHVAANPVPQFPDLTALGNLGNAEAQSDQAFQAAQNNAQAAGDARAQQDLNNAQAQAKAAFAQAQANAQRAG